MKITKVVLTRKYNLGNYESIDLSVEAELGPTDSIQETWAMLQDQADIYMAEHAGKPKQPPKPQTKPAMSPTDRVRLHLPKELDELLDYKESGDLVLVKPKHFLGVENFAKIKSIFIEQGGIYVSAGRDSHFEVPAPTEVQR